MTLNEYFNKELLKKKILKNYMINLWFYIIPFTFFYESKDYLTRNFNEVFFKKIDEIKNDIDGKNISKL